MQRKFSEPGHKGKKGHFTLKNNKIKNCYTINYSGQNQQFEKKKVISDTK